MVREEKVKAVQEAAEMINKYPVIGILDLYKIPASSFQRIKNELKGKAVVKVMKKSLLTRALEKSDKKDLTNSVVNHSAIIFSDMDPFRISKFLRKNKSYVAAKAGDIPKADIAVKAGPTDLPPGPSISTLSKANIKAKVEGGKIAIMKDCVICKAGMPVNADIVAALGLLKIQPMEIGMKIVGAHHGGMLYREDALSMDEDKLFADLARAYQEAVNLSINTGYPTKQTIELMLMKAAAAGKALDAKTQKGA